MKYLARLYYRAATKTGSALRRVADYLDPPGVGGAFLKHGWWERNCK
jgi:hypothetical protein